MVLVIVPSRRLFRGCCNHDLVRFQGKGTIISLDICSTLLLVSVWCRLLRRPYEAWNVTGNGAVSCEDGEHVQGVTYDVTIVQNSSVPCFLTSIGFMCSSSALGERIGNVQTCTKEVQTYCCCYACVRNLCCQLSAWVLLDVKHRSCTKNLVCWSVGRKMERSLLHYHSSGYLIGTFKCLDPRNCRASFAVWSFS